MRLDGQLRHLVVRGIPERGADGSVKRLYGSLHDITEMRRAEERILLLGHMLDEAPSSITIHDTEGRFLYANHKTFLLHGYNENEFLKLNLHELDVPESEALLARRFRKIAEQGEARFEVAHYRKDGSTFPLEILAKQIQWEGRSAIMSIATDITERKAAENALRESESRVKKKLHALLDPEGDIGTLNLADMLDCDEIQSVMNDFYALTEIGIAILDLDGNILVGTGWQDVCTKFHRVHPETAKFCQKSDTSLASGVEPGTFKIYKCMNNLWDIATPIVIGGKQVGNLFLGQFFFEDEAPDIATFREQAHRYGFDEDAYLKAFHAIPRWSRQTVDQVMTFYTNLINVISRLSYAHIKLARATEALRKSELLFQTMLTAIPDMISVHDTEMNVVYSNWNGFAAVPPDRRILGEKCYRLYRGCDKVCPDCSAKQVIETCKPYATDIDLPEGGCFERNVVPILNSDGSCGLIVDWVRDITGRKESEKALKQSEEKFRALVNNTIDWIWQTDANGAYIYVSDNTYEIMGYTTEELLGRTPFDFMDNQEANRVQSIFHKIVQNHDRIIALEDTLLHKDGHPVIFETNGTPLIDNNGVLQGYFGTCRDITERKRAEEDLSRQKRSLDLYNRIANIFLFSPQDEVFADVLNVILGLLGSRFGYFGYIDEAGDLVCPSMTRDVWDKCQVPEKSIVFPRSGWGGLWGRSLVEKQALIANENLRIPEGHMELENALATPIVHQDELIGQFVVANKDGGYDKDDRDLLQSAAAQTAPILFAIQERARQKKAHEKLEEQLRQAQKMEAVGRLAGGVAHDFNNMLGIIIGHSDLILENMGRNHPFYTDLVEIRKAGERSADLTRQLLAFARKQTVAPKVIDINKAVEGMLKMLRRLIGEDIDVAWVAGEKVWPVKIDPGQVDQILANLCVNARDAISGVGKVTIETGNIVLDENYCMVHAGFVPGEYTMLAVSDNGSGMDSETLSHLFEPFFTTKGQGKGTGLGLATVYGVVKQNNGYINVYSELEKGTTFKVYLPRHKAKAFQVSQKGPDRSGESCNETILLVEDELAILKMASMMLEREGYTVLGAATPGEAIRLATEHAGDIDLLMTDVVMPEMNGRELAKKILSFYPRLKCLFMSGYTANVIAHQGVLDEGVNFLQKPFSKNDLTLKVRDVLLKELGES
jgi:PAS domain S-box-containing protein